MGLFDIFKSKSNSYEGILDTLHCANRNEWTDGYKSKKPTELINKAKSLNNQKFFEYLKQRPRYLKLNNQLEINDGVSKIECSGDNKGYFVYLTYYLDHKNNKESDLIVQGMRLIKDRVSYEKNKGYKFGDSNSLEILNIEIPDKKKMFHSKAYYFVGFQYVDLDEDEYKLIRPLYSKIKNLKKDRLNESIFELFKGYHLGIGGTEKRKAYPINRYNSFFGFKEDL